MLISKQQEFGASSRQKKKMYQSEEFKSMPSKVHPRYIKLKKNIPNFNNNAEVDYFNNFILQICILNKVRSPGV